MDANRGLDEAAELMMAFAERTGLTSSRPPRRYLWTDAFAVCNFLGLARATAKDRYVDLAVRLIDQVHHVLGRHRDDDSRPGWLSGASEKDGALHPTAGGLRIGKKLPERRPDQPFDETLEWDRDGQYFHYLTKWMHALDQAARATGDARYSLWARELAFAAHRAFTAPVDGRGGRVVCRMVWKMSSDLSRVLVASMGQHDALDGLVTYTQLQALAARMPDRSGPDLAKAISDFADLCARSDWLTIDPLGLGGLLTDACRVEQLMRHGAFADGRLLDELLTAALDGVIVFERPGEPTEPAWARLAFRELGLVIGFRAVDLLVERLRDDPRRFPSSVEGRVRVELLARHLPLAEGIQRFWRMPAHRDNRVWAEHRDINEVMLATTLVSDGFLVLR